MAKVLIIGAGGVGGVVTHKCAQVPEVFGDIMLASRTVAKCKRIAAQIERPIQTAQVDADDVGADDRADRAREAGDRHQRRAALPGPADHGRLPGDRRRLPRHRELRAARRRQVRIQVAVGLPRALPRSAASWRCSAPASTRASTNVFCAYCTKHLFDEIHDVDIVDCNAGNHGQPFATNFNPEINIREITARGRYWENGEWKETDPLVGEPHVRLPRGRRPKKIFLLYHEELESLVEEHPGAQAHPVLDDVLREVPRPTCACSATSA